MSGKLFVTSGDSTELLQLIEETFDDMTLFVPVEIAIPRFRRISFRRNTIGRLLRFDKASNRQRSIGFIREDDALSERNPG